MTRPILNTRTIESLGTVGNPRIRTAQDNEIVNQSRPGLSNENVISNVESPASPVGFNPKLDQDGNLTPFEHNQLFIRAQAGDQEAIQLLGIYKESTITGTPFSTLVLPLARAGLDLAAQYLPQGQDAQRAASGLRGLADTLGIPGASGLIGNYTNITTSAVTTVRNILGGF